MYPMCVGPATRSVAIRITCLFCTKCVHFLHRLYCASVHFRRLCFFRFYFYFLMVSTLRQGDALRIYLSILRSQIQTFSLPSDCDDGHYRYTDGSVRHHRHRSQRYLWLYRCKATSLSRYALFQSLLRAPCCLQKLTPKAEFWMVVHVLPFILSRFHFVFQCMHWSDESLIYIAHTAPSPSFCGHNTDTGLNVDHSALKHYSSLTFRSGIHTFKRYVLLLLLLSVLYLVLRVCTVQSKCTACYQPDEL